jgi:hypothetical protein
MLNLLNKKRTLVSTRISLRSMLKVTNFAVFPLLLASVSCMHNFVCRNYSSLGGSSAASSGENNRNEKYVKVFSPSYKAIQGILNSNMDLFNKQKSIENKLVEYSRMEVENLILKRGIDLSNFGIRVIARQLKELEEDFNEYFNTKAFSKYKEYFNIVKDLDKSLILSVIMSKCIPFVIKYENIEDQPVTKLFKDTGQALLLHGAFYYYNNDVKNGKVFPKSNYKIGDYMIDNNIMLNEDEIISLGCDFVHFFSERSNFFEVRDIIITKDLRKRIILPKSDLKHLLNNITFLDSEELPMIINPLP